MVSNLPALSDQNIDGCSTSYQGTSSRVFQGNLKDGIETQMQSCINPKCKTESETGAKFCTLKE